MPTQKVQQEILGALGFFPPFFAPALDEPEVLLNLWLQTQTMYLRNPIPEVFKESFLGYTARMCSVPYCMIVHSCSLHATGVSASRIHALLRTAPPTNAEHVKKHMEVLRRVPAPVEWPIPGSDVEDAVFWCCVCIYMSAADNIDVVRALQRAIAPKAYAFLSMLLTFSKTCSQWVEMHPDISFDTDSRVQLPAKVLRDEEKVMSFFSNLLAIHGAAVLQKGDCLVKQIAEQKNKVDQLTLALDNVTSNAANEVAEANRVKSNLRQLAQESEHSWKALVQAIPQVVFQTDSKGNVVQISERWAELVTTEDTVSHGFCDMMHPEDRAHVTLVWNKSLLTGEPVSVEFRVNVKGDYKWYLMKAEPVKRDSGVERWVGTLTDVNEQKISIIRKESEANEKRYKLLFESIPCMVWSALPTGQMDYCNHHWLDNCGTLPTSITEWKRLMHHEDVPNFVEWWIQISDRSIPFDSELRLMGRDGEYQWFLVRAVPLKHEGLMEMKWFGTCTNIDGQKKAEAIQEAARKAAELVAQQKSRFVANISHEIRTPINGMCGMIKFLMDTPLTPEQADFVSCMSKSAEGLISIVNDVLDFSKTEANQASLQLSHFYVEGVMEEVCEMLMPLAMNKGTELGFLVDSETPLYLIGDCFRLRQILVNVVGNAVKFTEAGEIFCLCSVLTMEGNNVVLSFEVMDTGCGIDESVLPHLFTPFFQVDGSAARRHGGAGLGLTLAKQLVHLLGGEITVKSVKDKGSSFIFTTKFNRADSMDVENNSATLSVPITLKDTHVLCAADSPTHNQILSHVLAPFFPLSHVCTLTSISELTTRVQHWGTPGGAAGSGDQKVGLVILSCNESEYSIEVLLALATCMSKNAHTKDAVLVIVTSHVRIKRLPSNLLQLVAPPLSAPARYLLKPLTRAKACSVLLDLVPENDTDSCTEELVKQRLPGSLYESSSSIELKKSIDSLPLDTAKMRILCAEDNSINQKVLSKYLQKLNVAFDMVENGEEAINAVTYNPNKYALILMDLHMPKMDGLTATKAIRTWEAADIEKSSNRLVIVALTADVMGTVEDDCREVGFDCFMTKPINFVKLDHLLQSFKRSEKMIE